MNFCSEGATSVHLTWDAAKVQSFFPLLSQGVIIRTGPRATVRSILRSQQAVLALDLAGRIGGAFVDGKPVFDVDTTLVPTGATLALSGVVTEPYIRLVFSGYDEAKPTEGHGHDEGRSEADQASDEYCLLKIYNILAKDLGRPLLESGVRVAAKELDEFLSTRTQEFWGGFRGARTDGHEVDERYLKEKKWSETCTFVELTLHFFA